MKMYEYRYILFQDIKFWGLISSCINSEEVSRSILRVCCCVHMTILISSMGNMSMALFLSTNNLERKEQSRILLSSVYTKQGWDSLWAPLFPCTEIPGSKRALSKPASGHCNANVQKEERKFESSWLSDSCNAFWGKPRLFWLLQLH